MACLLARRMRAWPLKSSSLAAAPAAPRPATKRSVSTEFLQRQPRRPRERSIGASRPMIRTRSRAFAQLFSTCFMPPAYRIRRRTSRPRQAPRRTGCRRGAREMRRTAGRSARLLDWILGTRGKRPAARQPAGSRAEDPCLRRTADGSHRRDTRHGGRLDDGRRGGRRHDGRRRVDRGFPCLVPFKLPMLDRRRFKQFPDFAIVSARYTRRRRSRARSPPPPRCPPCARARPTTRPGLPTPAPAPARKRRRRSAVWRVP